MNKVWVAEFDRLCSAEFIVFSKREELNSQFLAARLNAEDFVEFSNEQASGERPRVDFEKLSHFPILLTPLAEQERIVTKLGAAFSRVDRAKTTARRARERLQRYRTAVLRSAVTGELTREWRKAQRDKNASSQAGKVQLQHLLTAAALNGKGPNCGAVALQANLPKSVPVALLISLLKSPHKIIAAYPAAVARIGPIHSSGGEKKVRSAAML